MSSQIQGVSAQIASHALRFLAVDAVSRANSGHPGAPLGMADMVQVLFSRHFRHSPSNPHYINRDRLVFSNGHASALYYAALHLSGYPLTIEDLKGFRSLHSKTPGHPESTETEGVDMTTGPLGQGLAGAVGMALSEKLLAAEFNTTEHKVMDHHTYVFMGDGCMMEGVSHEVAALAGVWKLNKLIALYDSNGISIDGKIDPWMEGSVHQRFESYGWSVITTDGHHHDAIDTAITQAKQSVDKPTLIICTTKIGFGAGKLEGTAKVHGSPIPPEGLMELRANLGWQYPAFEVPEEIYAAWNAKAKGQALEADYQKVLASYQGTNPLKAQAFIQRMNGDLGDLEQQLLALAKTAQGTSESIATRAASKWVLDFLGTINLPMLGGSADLTPSNLTQWQGSTPLNPQQTEGTMNYIHYGVREFGMFAILTGVAAHGGFIPFGGTFLVFLDYAKAALRLVSVMQKRVIYVLTHDSIGVGEDGPTHQPIEHLSLVRSIPQAILWRPADKVETVIAWQQAILNKNAPAVLALSRQNLPTLPRSDEQINAICKGGYILFETQKTPEIVFMASGSEVSLAMKAAQAADFGVRVVSVPSLCRSWLTFGLWLISDSIYIPFICLTPTAQ
jgi:transketolase